MNLFFPSLKSLSLFFLVLITFACSSKRESKPRVLVFSKTAGYHHESIADGNIAIQKLGSENNFEVDTTTNAAFFNEDSLKNYSTVVFLSPTGDVLDYRQEAAFERYIQAGGGYVGIHAAADCEYDWGWYGRMAGAYFLDHPGINDTFPNIQEGILQVVDKTNNATKHLPEQWKKTDEFYSYKKISKETHVILSIDEKSYNGGKNGDNHPMAWYHEYDGGRAFYTALGHTKESFSDNLYLKHLLGGIQYAIGENNKLNYSKAKSQLPPEENRFSKTQLVTGSFYEPTEMTVLPNLDILVIERRGGIKLYKHETQTIKEAGFFDVYFQTSVPGVNAEEGMLGLAKDPDFAKNHFVYIYYSAADSAVNRLSRFTFINDTLDKATEKVVIEVKSQRDICCHTGGSIAFGPDKILYFSAGDNSTPFDEKDVPYVNHGYAPLNDVPGHKQYDAGRSSGNSNDLRGKIMRLIIKDDGSYEIPEGNLFAKGNPKARPEIYVMGNRNPYRITVDQKNSFLYWGEVGPDARVDSFATRGPKGYDEINQARKAGFFGWPMFVGNNYPYTQYDYATGKSGAPYDPLKPINNSRNNTGLTELPPAQPAFIWYPYDASPDFPQVKTGGRNAMAGPVYYTDLYPKETRLPDYYNGKLFIYEWIRGWIKAVTMLPNGDFDKMEPFFPGIKVNSLIDMEVGPDGKFYLLEYGNGWFTKNPDAGIARIDYNGGNRPPEISNISIDKTSGILPLTIKATTSVTDPENDKISYLWNFGNGVTKETNEANVEYSYTTAGDFNISVVAKDAKGASAKSEMVNLYAGNETPHVSISLEGDNKSFYMPGKQVKYAVGITDNHDTSKLDPQNLLISVEYVEGFDKAASTMGHQKGVATIAGKSLMLSLDCKSCHKEAETSVGPAYALVAERYRDDKRAVRKLADKIINGGSGVWGEVAMPAHTSLSLNDASQIATWIMSIGNTKDQKKSLPLSGIITAPADQKAGTTMVISASYTDKGGNNIKALTGSASAVLRGNSFSFNGTEKLKGLRYNQIAGTNVLRFSGTDGWFGLDNIDLTGIASVNLATIWSVAPEKGVTFEIRLDAPYGKIIGKGTMAVPKADQLSGQVKLPVEKSTDGKLHTLYFLYKANEGVKGGISSVQFNAN